MYISHTPNIVNIVGQYITLIRYSLGVTRKYMIKNKYIRGTAQVRKFGNEVRAMRLRWFENIQKRNKGYFGKRMLEMELPGRRKRGRTKIRFVDVVREDM